MIRPPPRSTRTDTLFPYTTLFRSGVVIDMIDVGGGFPSIYPGLEPPAMEDYFAIIARHFEALPIAYNAELWCEPGRALCAESSSLIVRVERPRGEELFINDGALGEIGRAECRDRV